MATEWTSLGEIHCQSPSLLVSLGGVVRNVAQAFFFTEATSLERTTWVGGTLGHLFEELFGAQHDEKICRVQIGFHCNARMLQREHGRSRRVSSNCPVFVGSPSSSRPRSKSVPPTAAWARSRRSFGRRQLATFCNELRDGYRTKRTRIRELAARRNF